MNIRKRIPALLLGVILLFAGIPAGSISAQAADTTQQLNNIVLFAQFPDADTDNFMADKTDTAIAHQLYRCHFLWQAARDLLFPAAFRRRDPALRSPEFQSGVHQL